MQRSNTHIKGFRNDINGLRAWAVVAVILFHFSIFDLSSGFIGVDIFFVISGYLMTAIVSKGLNQQNFSFLQFYGARVRRIVPALLVIVLTLLALGWFLLPSIDYKSLAIESIASINFVSNVYFYLKTGYFDTAAHEKWLLHTWSLGVEAQFYILYPIILNLFWRIKKSSNALILGIFILFLISFIMNIYWSERDISASFYLLPMRAWELLAGGLVFFANLKFKTSDRGNAAINLLGWIFLLSSFALINNNLMWPYYWAFFPVLGTSLVIYANQEKNLLTNNYFAQWLGTRSYSLYLWHWPFSVALLFSQNNDSWLYVTCALCLCFLLAHLTYLYVENPARKSLQNLRLDKEIFVLAVAYFLFLSVGILIRTVDFKGRLSEAVEMAADGQFDRNSRIEECLGNKDMESVPYCQYGSGNIGAFIVGDSHANALVTGLVEATNKSVLQMTLRGCPVISGAKRAPWARIHVSPTCQNMINQLLVADRNYALPQDIPIIYTTSTSVYLYGEFKQGSGNDGGRPEIYFGESPVEDPSDSVFQQNFKAAYVNSICTIKQKYSNLYVTRPIPEMGIDVPRVYSRRLMFSPTTQDIDVPLAQYMDRNKLVWDAQDEAAKFCSVKILNPLPYLCDSERCFGTKDGKTLYFDDDHLSETGNKRLIPMFEKVFNQ